MRVIIRDNERVKTYNVVFQAILLFNDGLRVVVSHQIRGDSSDLGKKVRVYLVVFEYSGI